MSNAPTPKCWTCGKPMNGTLQRDRKTECPCCAFHSCGDCCIAHVRRAHPAWFAENIIPRQKRANDESRAIRALIHRPDSELAPVIPLARQR